MNYFKIKSTGIIILLIFSLNIFSQSNSKFNIYYSPENYTNSLNSVLAKNDIFKTYHLMLGSQIDPKNAGRVDQELFVKSITAFYPNSKIRGVLCIDIENKIYQDLFNFELGTIEYTNASGQFIWMLKTVKELRPNLKVGIYGIPFRAYYPTTKNTAKLDIVLSLVDYIFPSLYTMYPNNQNRIGRERNEKYLSDNLRTALEYGVRLNKPVIPFIWDVVHPSNKEFGGRLVSKKELLQNINFIKNFRYKNTSVKGIVWWDPDYKSFSKMVRTDLKSENNEPKNLQSKIFKDYLQAYIKLD